MATRIGKYQILAKIGSGAMGEVYRAHDPVLFRDVAIKTISATLASDPELRQRFHREARSAARLNHPNIVTVYDFGEEDGQLYMAMELLEGTELRELIARRALRTLDEKLRIMEQIADGLAFAHAKEVVHRDLKPGNIHVGQNGHVKVMDFGLARLSSGDMTRAGTVMGTPHYMSPEQVRGQRADARSDVFSLGVLFYEILSATRPFQADSMTGVMYQVVETEPVALDVLAPDLPGDLVALVGRALSKDPERRFTDAGGLRDALQEVRAAYAGQGSTLRAARTAGPSTPSPPPVEGALARAPQAAVAIDPTVVADSTVMDGAVRRRASRVGAAAAAVAAAGLAGWWVWASRSAPPVAAPAPTDTQMSAITRALVAQQLELARRDLAARDFQSALAQADRALALDAGNVEARRLRERAVRGLADAEALAQQQLIAKASPPTAIPRPSARATAGAPPVATAVSQPTAEPPRAAVVRPTLPSPVLSPAAPPTTVPASAAAAPTPVPAPAAAPPAEAHIRRAIEDYEAAFASLDPAAVKRVYPGIDKQFLDNLKNFRAYDMDLQVKQITIEGERARVLCTRTVVFRTFANTTRSLRPADEELILERRGDTWVRIR